MMCVPCDHFVYYINSYVSYKHRWALVYSHIQRLNSSYATAAVLSLGHSNRKCTVKTAFFIQHACVILWVNEYSTAYTVCCFISCFESSIIFGKKFILRVERLALRRGPISERTLFRVALFKLSYHHKWRRTKLKHYSQSEKRTFFGAVCELFWCSLWNNKESAQNLTGEILGRVQTAKHNSNTVTVNM